MLHSHNLQPSLSNFRPNGHKRAQSRAGQTMVGGMTVVRMPRVPVCKTKQNTIKQTNRQTNERRLHTVQTKWNLDAFFFQWYKHMFWVFFWDYVMYFTWCWLSSRTALPKGRKQAWELKGKPQIEDPRNGEPKWYKGVCKNYALVASTRWWGLKFML